MTRLLVENLDVVVDGNTLVSAASYSVEPGELVIILGPNGAGKTSLIRASLGFEKQSTGAVTLDDTDVAALSPADRARKVAYLPQVRPLAWPNSVRDIVSLGRFGHGAPMGRLQGADAQAVERAMADCDIAHLALRDAGTLSGGELARVHCARAFAVEAPFLVADEPIAGLDPRHQFRILDLFKNYVAKGGGALLILHDVELAARYATRLIWMKQGRIIADGPPDDTLTTQQLEDVYDIRASVHGLSVEMVGPK
ncbi:MAG: ABC transporter ATP-binding protein [Pseudomonadota bacterium]